MGKAVDIAGVVIALLAAFVAILAVFTLASRAMNERMDNSTKTMTVRSERLFSGQFSIYSAEYFNRSLANLSNASVCLEPDAKEVLIVSVMMGTDRLPDHCDVYVDEKVMAEIDAVDYDCKPYCADRFLIHRVDAKKQGVFEPHTAMVCCDALCLEKEVPELC